MRRKDYFYAGVLGLRLVKKTINFDAPEVYHLYFGDEEGSPAIDYYFLPGRILARANRRRAGWNDNLCRTCWRV